MEVQKLICFKSWAIDIRCVRQLEADVNATFAASATVNYLGTASAVGAQNARFTVTLPGRTFAVCDDAIAAIHNEAMRRIDGLPPTFAAR